MSSFWARRKAAVEAETKAEAELHAQQEAEAQEAALAQRSDAEILQELDLPDPDTLEDGDDFKVFLTEGVPSRLRTRALRRLWRVNPVLANVDGLVDYGEDFTDAALVAEGLETAYQVGKGMTAHVKELARQALAKESEASTQVAEDPEPAVIADPEPDLPDPADSDAADPAPVFVATAALPNPEPAQAEAAAAITGRMRFRFSDAGTGSPDHSPSNWREV